MSTNMFSQSQSRDFETLLAEVGESGEPFFLHTLNKGETLYRLSKLYGCSVDALIDRNQIVDISDLDIGQDIYIPVDLSKLVSEQHLLSAYTEYKAIYYQVKPKETVFRIARRYFDISQKQLKQNNNIDRNKLDKNQLLFIGWIETGVRPSTLTDEKDPLFTPNENKVLQDEEEIEVAKEEMITKNENPSDTIQKVLFESIITKGVAYWQKESKSGGGLYILHNQAPIGTLVEVTNLMFNKVISAKVLGRIPNETYSSDVLVVVSPTVAKRLGALDSRFYVKLRYLQPINTSTNR